MMLATYYMDSEIKFLTSTNPTTIYQLLHYHECYGVVALLGIIVLAVVILLCVLDIIHDTIHAVWLDQQDDDDDEETEAK